MIEIYLNIPSRRVFATDQSEAFDRSRSYGCQGVRAAGATACLRPRESGKGIVGRLTMTTRGENETDLRRSLEGIYGDVAVKHGNSRNMADISNDFHLRHRVCVRIGIAFFGMP